MPVASDRGTMTRGAGVDQQAPWGEATAPAARRMPTTPRERKPVLAVLAVLLIVGGALAAGTLVIKSGQRIGAIEVVQQVSQGAPIPTDALQEVQISADSGVNYVSWQFAGELSQYFAAMPIPKGTLLNNGMLTKTNALPADEAEVGLALKDGQIPGSLQAGDTIDVYSTASASGGCPGKPGSTLASDASVISVSTSASAANMTDVVIAMGTESVGPVVCNTANGSAGIAIMPRGGAG
jgi:hypothetical protein